MSRWRRAFRLPLHTPEALRDETDEEIRFHIDMRVEQLVRRGVPEAEARAEAVERFAGRAGTLDEARQELHSYPTRRAVRMTMTERVEDLVRDIRLAARSLGRTPGFVALAVLTLALGIGASTAIFSVVRGIALRPLPYHEPDRLVRLGHASMETVAPATFLDWRASTRAFERIAFAEYWTPNAAGTERPEELTAVRISADLLPMLGVRLAAGRAFTPDEARADGSNVTVISDALWHERFGADSQVVGRTMLLDGRVHTIVGVMPRDTPFVPFWAAHAQLAVPMSLERRATDRQGASLRVLGRVRPGVTLEQARADLAGVATRLAVQHPGTDQETRIVALHDVVVGDVRGTLYGVLAAVVCVLLIACANVAHLQLLRNAARTREFAIRTALGGTRGHLLRQSLLEGGVIALAAGAVGLALAHAGVRILLAFAPPNIPRLEAVRIDGPVLGFAAAVSVLAALLFALLPALLVRRDDLQTTLRDGGSSTGDGRQRVRARSLLVVSELAMALVLLTTAGLVIRTMSAMLAVDAGYDPRNVVSMRVSLRGTPDTSALRRSMFYRDVLTRAAALPGVQAASAVNHLPLHGDRWGFSYAVEGAPPRRGGERLAATFRIARPGYFDVMRIPLLQGREFSAEDLEPGARVVVINEVMAERHWPGGGALGRRITVDDPRNPDWFTVVGIARVVRQSSWTEPPTPEMYFPSVAETGSAPGRLAGALNPLSMTLVVRSAGDPSVVVNPLTETIRALGPSAAVSDIITMEQAVAEQFAVPRFYLTIFGLFAAVAVTLALVGVFGVLSHSVTRRRRELGLRLALGASRADPFRLVIREGFRLVMWGTIAGVGASLLVTQLVRGLLFGVQPADPATFVVASVVLGLIALVGCLVPAWRASSLDPIVALRGD